MAAWKLAGPELERIRNEELRQMSDDECDRAVTFLGVPLALIPVRESQIGKLAYWLGKLAKVDQSN